MRALLEHLSVIGICPAMASRQPCGAILITT